MSKYFQKGVSKVFVILIIIIAVFVIGAGVWFYLTTPPAGPGGMGIQTPLSTQRAGQTPSTTANATAGWQTYRNTTYGFEVKYPPQYSVQETKNNIISIKSPNETGPADLSIQINESPSHNSSLDAIIQDKIKNIAIKNQVQITLAGQIAYEGLDLGMVTSYIVLTKYNSNLYELIFDTKNQDTFSKNKANLDTNQKLMLSTFKFTK